MAKAKKKIPKKVRKSLTPSELNGLNWNDWPHAKVALVNPITLEIITASDTENSDYLKNFQKTVKGIIVKRP